MEIGITDQHGRPYITRIFLNLMRTFIFLLCTTVFGFTTRTTFSQEKVIVKTDQVLTVDEVFDLIKAQTQYRFIYPQDLFADAPKVDLKKGRISVERLLQQAVKKEDFNIILGKNDQILIKPKKSAIQRQVTGTVTDANGVPLQGVTVVLKGTTRGTLTDFDGHYAIQVVDSEQVLAFSYLGFTPQEITVGTQSSINVQMKENVSELGEVVVNAGYYTTTERKSTGSIEKVTADEIELQPVVNPLQALQGRMPGVEIVQQSGVTGLAASIQIRGQNSLRNSGTDNGNLPLFIVDGVPINSSPIRTSGLLTNVPGLDPLNALNLANVESIEVLKDADATAIYGSRGANGVVLITTKRAKDNRGGLHLDARVYSGISEASNTMDLLNTPQYLAMRRTAFENDGVEPTRQNAPDLTVWDQNRYTDWQEELFGGTAEITNMNFSLSGGNKHTSFVLGAGYHKEGSVFPGDFGFRKATGNFNLAHRSNDDRFRLNFSTNYGIDENKLFNNSFVNLALSLPPNAPRLYDDQGNLNWEENTWNNPFANLHQAQKVISNNLLTNLSMDYDIWRGLSAKINLGYSHLDSKELIKTPKIAYNPIYWENLDASSIHSNVERSSWIVEPQLSYGTNFGGMNIEVLVGLTLQNSSNTTLISTGLGYSQQSLIGNLAAADQVRVNINENVDYRYAAAFGRIGVNWKETYYLNLTGRRDGSSRFGRGNRLSNFGAIGAAWIFSEEAFLKSSNILNYGKLRGSYGTTGSDQIPDYGYLDTYQPTRGPGGLYATQLTNPDYSWETNKKLEAALELGLLNNRVQAEVNWYRNRSSNQLVGYPLPATTGFSTVQANLPATIQNTGWEFSLTTINLKSDRFNWQTSLNLTIPRNKLVAFENIDQTSYQNIYRVGQPLNIALLFQYEGIDPETGLYQIADINGDSFYNYDDRVIIENLGRKSYAGINNSFSYKDISLQFLFEYVQQKKRTYFAQASTPGFDVNQSVEVLNAWENPDDDTNTQILTQAIPGFLSHYDATRSELAVGDASFLRLKTITLSYNLPRTVLKKIKIADARLFAHGQNLFTLTDYLGLDPQGGLALPPMRTITCGLQVKF